MILRNIMLNDIKYWIILSYTNGEMEGYIDRSVGGIDRWNDK